VNGIGPYCGTYRRTHLRVSISRSATCNEILEVSRNCAANASAKAAPPLAMQYFTADGCQLKPASPAQANDPVAEQRRQGRGGAGLGRVVAALGEQHNDARDDQRRADATGDKT